MSNYVARRYIAAMSTSSLLLERLSALIQQAVRDDAARHGLLPIQLQVLHYLAQANRYSDLPIAIAEYFGITRGTVSQTLAVLERRGLLIKQADPRHGKRIHLLLTDNARQILEHSWVQRLDSALHSLPTAEHTEAGLRELLSALQRLNGQQAFGICQHCVHFCPDSHGHHCGLTGEPLESEQSQLICREWQAPAQSRET